MSEYVAPLERSNRAVSLEGVFLNFPTRLFKRLKYFSLNGDGIVGESEIMYFGKTLIAKWHGTLSERMFCMYFLHFDTDLSTNKNRGLSSRKTKYVGLFICSPIIGLTSWFQRQVYTYRLGPANRVPQSGHFTLSVEAGRPQDGQMRPGLIPL
jgi:hypothetical protein